MFSVWFIVILTLLCVANIFLLCALACSGKRETNKATRIGSGNRCGGDKRNREKQRLAGICQKSAGSRKRICQYSERGKKHFRRHRAADA